MIHIKVIKKQNEEIQFYTHFITRASKEFYNPLYNFTAKKLTEYLLQYCVQKKCLRDDCHVIKLVISMCVEVFIFSVVVGKLIITRNLNANFCKRRTQNNSFG